MEGNIAAPAARSCWGPTASPPWGSSAPASGKAEGQGPGAGSSPCPAQPPVWGKKNTLSGKTESERNIWKNHIKRLILLPFCAAGTRAPESWQGGVARALGQRAMGEDRAARGRPAGSVAGRSPWEQHPSSDQEQLPRCPTRRAAPEPLLCCAGGLWAAHPAPRPWDTLLCTTTAR